MNVIAAGYTPRAWRMAARWRTYATRYAVAHADSYGAPAWGASDWADRIARSWAALAERGGER